MCRCFEGDCREAGDEVRRQKENTKLYSSALSALPGHRAEAALEFSIQTFCGKEDGDSRKEAKDRTHTALGAATQHHKVGRVSGGRGGLSQGSPALVSVSRRAIHVQRSDC